MYTFNNVTLYRHETFLSALACARRCARRIIASVFEFFRFKSLSTTPLTLWKVVNASTALLGLPSHTHSITYRTPCRYQHCSLPLSRTVPFPLPIALFFFLPPQPVHFIAHCAYSYNVIILYDI